MGRPKPSWREYKGATSPYSTSNISKKRGLIKIAYGNIAYGNMENCELNLTRLPRIPK